MSVDATLITAQIHDLLQDVERARQASPHADLSGGLPASDMREIRIRLLASVHRLAPAGSIYVKQADSLDGHDGYVILRLAGILTAFKRDVEAGYLLGVEELLRADIFSDFLEMAEELHAKGYKDSAAVLVGSVMEQHLRKLALRAGITIEIQGKAKKADALNNDLAKASHYNKLTQKMITAQLDLRNKAAHGQFDQYDSAHVEAMIRDVKSFLVRYPA